MTMEADDLDELVIRARSGDREAFDGLVGALELEVRSFVAAQAPSLALVDEVVQAAFVTAYHQLVRYESRGTFAAWVKGIARNLLRRELTMRSRLVATDLEALDALLAGGALEELEQSSRAAEVRTRSSPPAPAPGRRPRRPRAADHGSPRPARAR